MLTKMKWTVIKLSPHAAEGEQVAGPRMLTLLLYAYLCVGGQPTSCSIRIRTSIAKHIYIQRTHQHSSTTWQWPCVWTHPTQNGYLLHVLPVSSPPVTTHLLSTPPSSPMRPPSSVPSWLVPSRAKGRRRVRRAGEEGEGRAPVVPYCNLYFNSVHWEFYIAHIQCTMYKYSTHWLCTTGNEMWQHKITIPFYDNCSIALHDGQQWPMWSVCWELLLCLAHINVM